MKLGYLYEDKKFLMSDEDWYLAKVTAFDEMSYSYEDEIKGKKDLGIYIKAEICNHDSYIHIAIYDFACNDKNISWIEVLSDMFCILINNISANNNVKEYTIHFDEDTEEQDYYNFILDKIFNKSNVLYYKLVDKIYILKD